MENSVISGIANALNSGNGNSPAGYINAKDTDYFYNGIRTKLEVTNNNTQKDGALIQDADEFISALPYSYVKYDSSSLEELMVPFAGAGKIKLETAQWEKSTYYDNNEIVTANFVESEVGVGAPKAKLDGTFEEIKNNNYDGMIITGAPVEKLDFEEVNYWDELITVMEWSKKHVTSTIHICWGAQAGLYYHYGIKKVLLDKKLSGVYRHHVLNRKEPLVRGFDDYFMAPHSRYTEACREDILNNKQLKVFADSQEAGIYIVIGQDGKHIFVMGHPEYDRMTLDQEYKRDYDKGLEPELPVNYYPDDDCNRKPVLSWRSHANNLYTNWLNYYVYQTTPYDLTEIR